MANGRIIASASANVADSSPVSTKTVRVRPPVSPLSSFILVHLLPSCSSCPYSLSVVSLSVVTYVDIRTVPELQPQELVANGWIIADNNEISD